MDIPFFKNGRIFFPVSRYEDDILELYLYKDEKNFFSLTCENVDGCVSFGFLDFDFPIKRVELRSCFSDVNTVGEILVDNSFPSTDKEYEKTFIRKVQRFGNSSVQFFTALQIFKFFSGKTAYRCNAAVVMGYKAVEINDRALLDVAKKSVLDASEFVSKCEVEWHPRRNSQHLKYSLFCVAYHIAIAQKDAFFLDDIIANVASDSDEVDNFFTPSYPIGLVLLLGLLVGLKKGQDVKELNFFLNKLEVVFKKAVRDSTIDQLTLFEELGVTHKSVVLAKKLIKGETDEKSVFHHISRVRGKRLDSLFLNFEEMYEI